MNIVRFNPVIPSGSIFKDMFEDLFTDDFFPGFQKGAMVTEPLVNILEEKEMYRIDLAVPGMKREDISVNLEKDQLVIKAEVEAKNENEDTQYRMREFYYGQFTKSFHIPDTVDRNQIQAGFENGVLSIELKKREEAIDHGPKQIEIK